MRELAVEKRLVRLVREAGGKCLKAEGMAAGFVDRVAILPQGRVAWIELKRPSGRLSVLQGEWRKDLQALGQEYWCCWNHEEVDKFVESL